MSLYPSRPNLANTYVISRFCPAKKNILKLFLNFDFCIQKVFIFV